MHSTGETASSTIVPAVYWQPMPQIDLRQLLRLTDDTGMFQHATHLLPDPTHGYCIDDNARALIAALLHAQLRGYDEHTVPLQRYLGFVAYALNPTNGRFRNFMSYDRRWLEDAGSEDSHGRAIWALGIAVQRAPSPTVRELAAKLLREGLPACQSFDHLRPRAFIVLGLTPYLTIATDDTEVRALRDRLAQQLFDIYQSNASDDWPWWENELTWGNARLPHALLLAGNAMNRSDMVAAALTSLQWCIDVQTAPDGHLSIIGNDGWYKRGQTKAQFDQQPLEAYALVHACLDAARITDDNHWANHAWNCFEWFRGHNDLNISLYHEETGGCQDGLHSTGPNLNQGAESTLAYLLSVLELHHYLADRSGRITVASPQTLGLGVIGASSFADFSLEQYRHVDKLRPTAIWNRTTHKAQQLAAKYDMTAHEQLDAMLNDPSVHLIYIASTPDLHAQQAIAALQAGKHVLCEKPLAITQRDAQRMIQAATARDRQLGVNFMMRFGPLVQLVKQLIDSQILGQVVHGQFTNRAGDAGLPPDHWFWDEKRSGGIFVEHGVHTFDLVRYWLGDATVLGAMRLRRPRQENIIDQVACDLRFGQQTTVNFYHGFLQPSALDQQDLRLIFERGQVNLVGWVASELTLEAALDEAAITKLQTLLPDATIETLEQFAGSSSNMHHRQHQSHVDRLIRMHYRVNAPKQEIYGNAVRDLMQDMVQAIQNRQHMLTVSTDDARIALELALDADRLAKGVTP